MLRPAAFIDRDGVLNEDHGYVHRWQDFRWLPGATDALARLQRAGLALVVVTNQSGIARGLYTCADMEQLHQRMADDLQRQGVVLTGVYACPHHPQAVRPEYRLACDCRKPMPGLMTRAAHDHGLDLAASCLFGDKPSDIQAGRSAGVGRCWFIGDEAAALDCAADGARASLYEAVQALLAAAGHTAS